VPCVVSRSLVFTSVKRDGVVCRVLCVVSRSLVFTSVRSSLSTAPTVRCPWKCGAIAAQASPH